MSTNAKTWRELRDLLNAADDAALDQPIVLLGEGTHRKGSVTQLSEDLYDDGEYINSVSELSTDFLIDGPPIYAKGGFLVDADGI